MLPIRVIRRGEGHFHGASMSDSNQKQGLDEADDKTDQWRASVSSRLGGQVRDFGLEVRGNSVIVRGNCRSYYTTLHLFQMSRHPTFARADRDCPSGGNCGQ